MIYEYRCEKCGAVKEFWMKMSDPDPEECPDCGPAALSRVISKTTFALKGGGWYASGYQKTSSSSDSASSSSKSTCSSGACSETKKPKNQ